MAITASIKLYPIDKIKIDSLKITFNTALQDLSGKETSISFEVLKSLPLRKIKETLPFTIATKKNKIPRNKPA